MCFFQLHNILCHLCINIIIPNNITYIHHMLPSITHRPNPSLDLSPISTIIKPIRTKNTNQMLQIITKHMQKPYSYTSQIVNFPSTLVDSTSVSNDAQFRNPTIPVLRNSPITEPTPVIIHNV